MTNQALLKSDGVSRSTKIKLGGDWEAGPDQIVVGKDVLELLSSSMYVDPLTIYREYIQNAADAIDEAHNVDLLIPEEPGEVSISLDSTSRSIVIRDNGIGLAANTFAMRMCNLGASEKRGTAARGFRGVGRLAGLGYCQELVFRSRSTGDKGVTELKWDCRRLKQELRSPEFQGNLADLVRNLVSMRRIAAAGYPIRFFEVELRGIIRHRNDRLLNPQAVSEYLAQVAPVPFAPDFRFDEEISTRLKPYVSLGNIQISVNGSPPIYRPHRNSILFAEDQQDDFVGVDFFEIPGIDGNLAAVGWVLHHGYRGAIPTKALVKGLRLRDGNMQVGDNAVLEELFPEPRFNAWSVGEVHVIDSRIMPNGRRDHFEQSVHFDNLLNQLAPTIRDISRHCRQSSISRKWLRDFELQKAAALEKAAAVARGGLSKQANSQHRTEVAHALNAMEKVVSHRQLSDEVRTELADELRKTTDRVTTLLAGKPKTADPLSRFRPQVRDAYQHVISLIYNCSTNRNAAKALVTKILAKIEVEEVKSKKSKSSRHPISRKRRSAPRAR